MGKNIGADFPPEDIELIRRVVSARRESVSTFLRRAARAELARLSFLPDFDKKALAIGQSAPLEELASEVKAQNESQRARR